jgi:hypothetical protein
MNIVLATTNDCESKILARFDIQNELEELEKDLTFLKFIQSSDVYNIEQFVDVRLPDRLQTQFVASVVKNIILNLQKDVQFCDFLRSDKLFRSRLR